MSLAPSSVPSAAGVQPFHGYVESTADALCIIEAARRGHLPRITRRLNELERRSMIHSGAVFVFSVEESGIKRWTEGLAWSQSRISGNFLVYREVTDRSAIRSPHADPHEAQQAAQMGEGHKPNGLLKKTITVKIDGSDHHLISYYTQEDIRSGRLQRPTTRPDLMSIEIPQELLQSANFRYPLRLEPRYAGNLTNFDDADEMDNQGGGGFSPGSVSSRTSGHLGQQGEQSASLSTGGPATFSRSPTDSTDASNHPQGRHYGSVSPPASHRTEPAYARAIPQTSHVQGQYGGGIDNTQAHAISASWPPPDHGSHQSFSSVSAYHAPLPSQLHTHPAYAQGEGIWAQPVPSASGLDRGLDQTVQSVGGHIDSSSWSHYSTAQPFAPAPSTASSLTANLPTARREHTRNRSYPPMHPWVQTSASAQDQYPSTGHQYSRDQASSAGTSDAAAGGQSFRDPTYHQPR